MRYLLTFGYWTLAVLLLAGLTVSFGYGFDEALFIASSMLPGMFCAKLLLPAALRTPRRRAVAVLCVAVGTLVVEWLSLLLVHRCSQLGHWQNPLPFPALFSNPAFLILLLAAIVVPEMLFARWIDARLPHMKRVTFVSERRKVTLAVADILYVESCDSEVLVHTVGGGEFRNRTRISQWESLLDERFVRIHRSYLVNAEHVGDVHPGRLSVGGRTLEISRKYRERVAARFASAGA